MINDVLDIHEEALRTFDQVVHQVREDQWDESTPCGEWSVRNVVNHVVCEQMWAPHLLAGQTSDEVGDRYDGDLLGGDPVDAWKRSCAAAHAAWTGSGATDRTAHLSFWDTASAAYCRQMAGDLVVQA